MTMATHWLGRVFRYADRRYRVVRRYQKASWRVRKFYRRYLGLSPGEKQRRQLNRDFQSSPKTCLLAAHGMNLHHLQCVRCIRCIRCVRCSRTMSTGSRACVAVGRSCWACYCYNEVLGVFL